MPNAVLGILVFFHTLGAAVWFGGTVWIAITNRSLRARMADAERRDLVRHLGRTGAPVLWGALAVAATSGFGLWARSGYAAAPLALAKVALVFLAAMLTEAHVRLGQRDSVDVKKAALLGMGTLVTGLALFFLGAGLRQA